MANFKIELQGFQEALDRVGPQNAHKIKAAARMAVNSAVDMAYKLGKDRMTNNVNFPVGYLDQEDRFAIKKKASDDDLSAVLYSRSDATSLARFARQQAPEGVRVSVKRGNQSKLIRNSWIAGLRGAKDDTGMVTKSNRGLLVRSELPTGPKGSYKAKPMGSKWPNIWIVYGPSVYQVFRQSMKDFEPEITAHLNAEFARHYERLLNNGN